MATNIAAKRGRCPHCGREFTYTSVAQHKCFPFCSERCRDIDLGKWMTGGYVVPGEEGSAYIAEDDELSPERHAT